MRSPYKLNRRSRKRVHMAMKHYKMPFRMTIAELEYLEIRFALDVVRTMRATVKEMARDAQELGIYDK